MTYANLYDSHTHSKHSHDGRDSADAICVAAIAAGLRGIAVTDHCDIHAGRAECMRVLGNLKTDIARARDRYGESLRISLGIELGEIHHNCDLATEVSSDPAVDFVIGSLHCLRGEEDFYFIDYDRVDVDSLMSRYYDELLEMAEIGDFDSMAHINYQVRYMSDLAFERFNPLSHRNKLELVLEKLAERGKALEINTSSGRRDGHLVPTPEVVRMFAASGGRTITTGSDAHRARRVGHRLAEAMDMASASGFDKIAFFERRNAMLFDLA